MAGEFIVPHSHRHPEGLAAFASMSLDRPDPSTYFLIGNFSEPCRLLLRNGAIAMRPGESVLVESAEYLASLVDNEAADRSALQLSAQWLARWLRNPQRIVRRKIDGSGWARVLSELISQLVASSHGAPACGSKMFADQLGSMLRIVESELLGGEGPGSCDALLADRIARAIRQRSSEVSLCARDICESLAISERTLHRHLRSAGRSFGDCLQDSRINVARQMLESWHFRDMTTAQIGVRAGFGDASHFTRAFRASLGKSPDSHRQDCLRGVAAVGVAEINVLDSLAAVPVV